MTLMLPEPPLSEMSDASLLSLCESLCDYPADHEFTKREGEFVWDFLHEVLRRIQDTFKMLGKKEEEARAKVKEAETNLQNVRLSIQHFSIEISTPLARFGREISSDAVWETIPLSEWIDLSPAVKRMYAPYIDRGLVVVEGFNPRLRSGKMKRKNGRVPLTTEIRLEVIFRDRMICQHCGKKGKKTGQGPDGLQWEIDHIIPVSKGGTNEMNNLVLSCKTCNQWKKARWIEPARRNGGSL